MGEKDNPPTMDLLDILEDDDPDQNYWVQMMEECQLSSDKKLPSSKALLVLGNGDQQKTQLVGKIQGSGSKLRKGNGLEYHFLNVRDEYCENHTKLDVWLMDEEESYERLLRYVLNGDTVEDTTVILTASMARPWEILHGIHRWTRVVEEQLKRLDVGMEVVEQRKTKVLSRYREYVEPTASIYGTLDGQSNSSEIENNLGIEIIVVVTETEHMTMLQSEFGYIEEHFDFIQYTLRKFCLSYGAALCYVSVKEDRNCDLLLKYILHKIYSFPFRIPAMFLDRDSIFVPAGWDSENKIQVLAESLATISFSSLYEDVIFKPSRVTEGKNCTLEVEAQADQGFLQTLQAALQRHPADIPSDANRDSSGSTQRNPRRVSRSPGVRSPQKKLESKLSTSEGDTVLHTFFKSLLNRRTSAPADRPIGLSGNRDFSLPSTSRKSADPDNPPSASGKTNGKRDHFQQSRSLRTPEDYPERPFDGATIVEDELNSSDTFKTLLERQLREMQGAGNVDHFAEFLKKYKPEQSTAAAAAAPNSLEDDEDSNPLPGYFMSSQAGAFCPADCCSLNTTATNGNSWDDHDMGLDRVKSKFNPPLRLLLESSQDAPYQNGKTKQDDGKQSSPETENVASTSGTRVEQEGPTNAASLSSPISAKPDVVVEALKMHVGIGHIPGQYLSD